MQWSLGTQRHRWIQLNVHSSIWTFCEMLFPGDDLVSYQTHWLHGTASETCRVATVSLKIVKWPIIKYNVIEPCSVVTNKRERKHGISV